MQPTNAIHQESGSQSSGHEQGSSKFPGQGRHVMPAQGPIHQDDPSARALLQQAFQRTIAGSRVSEDSQPV